jgi:hypothetical protein
MENNVYKVKFFGSKKYKEQLQQVKMEVETRSRAEVENVLRYKYGFVNINGLKIR